MPELQKEPPKMHPQEIVLVPSIFTLGHTLVKGEYEAVVEAYARLAVESLQLGSKHATALHHQYTHQQAVVAFGRSEQRKQ